MTEGPPRPSSVWAEPGAELVAPGVYRIPLPLPTPDLKAVNVYAILDDDGIVLIDSGWAGPAGEQALKAGLREIGHDPGDISSIVVTHAHPDHYTQSVVLRRAHGPTVLLGRGERPSVDAAVHDRHSRPPQEATLRAHGAADLATAWAAQVIAFEAADATEWELPDVWLDDRAELRLAGRAVQVRETPGHTRGHIVLRDPAAGLLFAGDHVLPHITPSIGYERRPEPAPLRSYFASLHLVRDLPDLRLLPAHGPVAASVHTRIDELLAHHDRRLADVVTEVRAGAVTAFAVAARLPWTRRRTRLEDLEVAHQTLAVLEIAAHLDVLVETGTLVTAEVDGVHRYALS